MKKVFILLCIFFASCWGKTEDKIEQTEQKLKQEKTILALGDSLTAWYGLQIQDSYPSQLENILKKEGYNYKVINAGISGDTSKGVVERLPLYEDLELDIVVLVIGANDWLRGNSTKDMKENIAKTIQTFQQSWVQVILGWMDLPLNLWLNYRNDFKKVYKNIAKQEDIPLIDFFLEWVAGNRTLNLPDGIHPTKNWYAIVVQNLYDFLIRNELIYKW
jgi:acyl-CoA thioesterase-1